ncbi:MULTISPECIES: alpha/beta fold hydrolase [unclassified Variovorax]|jgi:predicted alpha/beta-fold hydrolase|uniref:YheT family hydrolase n=1 Tax=unclassified Variovorax TaxID=663243 RepID=UPI000F7E00E5|nr:MULTISPECIES: alpha/beta fold hydrolase [unclassified Variovorax]RSZ32782.1 alpha/beta fold hydrolase [Variovorax sp. 553]RSZ33148.1 alpha/beta fold hydrolase [Variovorax sp. 679]
MDYAAPLWLPGGNLQTIWAALYARRFDGPAPVYRRERWPTPDGDFIDVDFVDAPVPGPRPLLVLFHGLEGSSRSHYAEAFAAFAASRDMAFAVPHFRGCSGELNLAPRAYHSGDFEEIGWILARMREQHSGKGGGPVLAAGVSLGGNALMRWASEAGETASSVVSAVASVCAPLDLAAGGDAIGRGFNKLVYTRMFLATMKPKALAKLAQFPGLFDRERLMSSRNLYEFDDVFTAPLHGFRDTDDYWARGSAKPHLSSIRVPALVVNARNDPFIPAQSLPKPGEVGAHVTLWQPEHGGHVGFPMGPPPGHVRGMPERVGGWLQLHGGASADGGGLSPGRECRHG